MPRTDSQALPRANSPEGLCPPTQAEHPSSFLLPKQVLIDHRMHQQPLSYVSLVPGYGGSRDEVSQSSIAPGQTWAPATWTIGQLSSLKTF